MADLKIPMFKGRATITIRDEFRGSTTVTHVGYTSDFTVQDVSNQILGVFKALDKKIDFITMKEEAWREWIKHHRIGGSMTEKKLLNLANKYFKFSTEEEAKLKRWVSEEYSGKKETTLEDVINEGVKTPINLLLIMKRKRLRLSLRFEVVVC